jgi:chitinase
MKETNMKTRYEFLGVILLMVVPLLSVNESKAQPKHWITAYYGGWQLGNGSNGYLPVSKVDFTAMTDVVHFALVPRPDGSLDSAGNSITSSGSHALINAAHAVGTRVLISIGGWNSEPGFVGATGPQNLTKFVMNISLFMTSRGYDGIDIDWEPISPQNYRQFVELVKTLREAIGPSFLLVTTAGAGDGRLMASVQAYLNQINIMTYDLSFPSQGWFTWYNDAVHQNGVTFKSTGGPVPACDNIVESFISSGVAREKIGIGAEFGGSVWKGGLTSDGNGVTGPVQSWINAPSIAADVPYFTIMRDYYTKERYHWDPGAMASYLSIDSAGSAGDCFISYDDSNDIVSKIEYVRKAGLGGIILYELGMGYMGNGKIPLLEAVKATSLVSDRQETSPASRHRR